MDTFTLSQAREGSGAVRMVSVRTAVPFLPFFQVDDILTFGAMGTVIMFICVLIYKESRKSRLQNDSSRSTIERERDQLSRRIGERTQELIDAETEHLHELNRTSQLGELSRGLFHDLMNPLASISMHMDKLGNSSQETVEAQEVVRKVITITKRMNGYMESVKRCIGPASELTQAFSADIADELPLVEDILGYKARMTGVELHIDQTPSIIFPIHPVRLHQLLLNLISNAADACIEDSKTTDTKEYVVSTSVFIDTKGAHIKVSDNGCGMTQEHISGLFKDYKSTKPQGIGIGLKTVKAIIDELEGTITVSSSPRIGSTFFVHIPPHKYSQNN
jgi:C4-dicarboxylate-specific signal transduction histidine kinase